MSHLPGIDAPVGPAAYLGGMRQPVALILSVPQPCSEDWEAMPPTGAGRHCAACRKTVTDFTGWSDGAIAAFYSKPENATACGRFWTAQLDRPLHLPHQPHSSLYRWVAAAGIAAITLAALPAGAQTGHPPVPHVTVPATSVSDTGSARRPLTAAELEKLPVRAVYPLLTMGAPPLPRSNDTGAIRSGRSENTILIIDGMRRDSSGLPRPERAPAPEEIETMPIRRGTLIGYALPQPAHVPRESPMRGTFTGEQIDNLHLRNLDDLLK